MSDTASRIAIGVIRKPHGVRGEASVEPWTDSVGRFRELSSVTIVSPAGDDSREVTVESARAHGDRALVKFAEIGAPEEIRLLRGWTIEIPEAQARRLEPGEYFLHHLVGLRLIDTARNDRGEVTGVAEGGGGVLLNVRRADGKMYDVPFVVAICKEVDVAGGTMIVALPDGIDED